MSQMPGDARLATESDAGVSSTNIEEPARTPQEAEYYRHGGILQYVLRQLL